MSLLKRQLAQALNVCRGLLTRKLRCDPDLPTDIIKALWEDPDHGLLPFATPLQVKDRCVVMRCDLPQGSFVLKRHSWGSYSRTARMLLREPTAVRCAAFASFLSSKGVPTPRPRLCLVQGFGPFSYRSYLLTDFVEGTSLFHFIRTNAPSSKVVRGLACQVASIWQQLVDLEISHNDLKPENFIVDQALQVWIIDFEKVRVHRDEAQLLRRHLEDARIFLHVRNWRDQPEAAEIFRKELLQTSLGKWLASSPTDEHRLLQNGYSLNELANRISVAIVAKDRQIERRLLANTIDSIKDLADEIVHVGPSASNGQFEVLETIELKALGTSKSLHKKLKYPWVLVLQAGECATPDLVRQLPERVVDQTDWDAGSFPMEKSLSGHSMPRYRLTQCTPIRVFHQDRCKFSLQDGVLRVTADPARIRCLDARIRALDSSADQLAWHDRLDGAEALPDAA